MAEQAQDVGARPKTLVGRMAAVMGEMEAIPQSGWNAFHKYKFTESSAIMATLRPLFAKHGIAFLPEVLGYETRGEGKSPTTICRMRFTLLNADDPADRLVARWLAEAQDSGDKAINKTITAGTKFWLLKTFLISDKDEADADADDTPQPQQARQMPPQGRAPAPPARPPQPAQRPASYEDIPDTATAPPEVLAGLRRTAATLQQATGQLTPIEDGITMGDARSLKQAMKDAMDKAAPAGQQPAKATPPQIDRLLKLLAALGRPATVPPDLTSEDANARIRELVGIFNQQARGHTQPAAVGGK